MAFPPALLRLGLESLDERARRCLVMHCFEQTAPLVVCEALQLLLLALAWLGLRLGVESGLGLVHFAAGYVIRGNEGGRPGARVRVRTIPCSSEEVEEGTQVGLGLRHEADSPTDRLGLGLGVGVGLWLEPGL